MVGRIGRLVLLAACVAPLATLPVLAQAPRIPRTGDGHPDFEGVWESLWLTPLERAAGVPLDIPQADVDRVMQQFASREVNRAKNQLDTEGEIAIASKLMRVGGVYRGSQVIDPPDGRIPRVTTAMQAGVRSGDGPESYTRQVRCISGGGAAPMSTANFDQLHRIVQTPDHVVIYSEHINDTRIMPLGRALAAGTPRSQAGSSVARWDGDELVVETSHIDGSRPAPVGTAIPLSDDAVIVERFRLNGPDELDFRYTVTDPRNYKQPWTGEMAWVRSNQRLYETVCHEANYSLANMLRAARIADDRKAAAKDPN